MRDSLSFVPVVPVRLKLPLIFSVLYLVAFGLGGYVATKAARSALERQIRLRLSDRAAYAQGIIDNALALQQWRAEAFAADGQIRLALARLQGPEVAGSALRRREAAQELARHLRTHKLTLAPELADARVLGRRGELLLRAVPGGCASPARFDREGSWFGPLTAPAPDCPYPTFVLSTPVYEMDGRRRLGYLQLVVRADVWAAGLRRALARGPREGFEVALASQDGGLLRLVPGAGDAGRERRRLAFSSVNARTGWSIGISVDRESLTVPVSTLVATFLLTELAMVVLTTLVFFPSWQYLLRPLTELQNAARRISGGDFSVRARYQSGDEVGQLAAAFNVMAGAVEERTRRLEEAAADLRRREEEIRIERDRLETVIHSMEDGLFILDRDGRPTLANAAAGDVLRGLAESPAGFRQPAQAQPCEVAIGPRIYDLRATPLRDRDGREVERVFVSRDITERIRQADRQAHQERLAVLGEIAAVMAHELNNPLAAISMFSQMLLDGLVADSPLHQHAEVIHRNMMSCKRTIRSLLDLTAAAQRSPGDLDVRDLVDDVVELLRPLAGRSGTELRVDAEAEDGLLHADELQLRQALVNLVMNAIQAVAPRGGGEVRVGTLERGGDLVIRVRDDGPGIPAELRERVFEPFFTTKPPGEGTGLGLPTTRRIVEAQGGRLVLCEAAEGGAAFEMVLARPREAAA
ncbi:MAG TPA: ATP-binding protein [Thermoanaerobaculia bacterium]